MPGFAALGPDQDDHPVVQQPKRQPSGFPIVCPVVLEIEHGPGEHMHGIFEIQIPDREDQGALLGVVADLHRNPPRFLARA